MIFSVVCPLALDRYKVEPSFRALFADEGYAHYRVAMAYLGPRWGVGMLPERQNAPTLERQTSRAETHLGTSRLASSAMITRAPPTASRTCRSRVPRPTHVARRTPELVELALRRGATVELLLPARANVYANANLKAAQTLLDAGWPTLSLRLDPQMMHAKVRGPRVMVVCPPPQQRRHIVLPPLANLRSSAPSHPTPGPRLPQATLARSADGTRCAAFVGSANLVRGSLNLPVWLRLLPFDELNVLVQEETFCDELDGAMDGLFASAGAPVAPGARLLERSEWYSETSAWLDELWQ